MLKKGTGLFFLTFMLVIMSTRVSYAEPFAENSVYAEDFISRDLQKTGMFVERYPVEMRLCGDQFIAELSDTDSSEFVIEAEVTFINKVGDNYICLNEAVTSTTDKAAKIVVRKPGAVAVYAVITVRRSSSHWTYEIGDVEYRNKALKRKYEHSGYCKYEIDDLTKSASITGYVGGEDVCVPSEIDGFPVRKIALQAFYRNGTIKTVDISEGVITIERSAFDTCGELTNVKLPEGLKSIDNKAFWNCKKLSQITLPESLEKLGNGVFCGCDAITELKIPKNLSRIDNYALACQNLKSIVVDENNKAYYSEGNCVVTKEGNTVIAVAYNFKFPEGLTEVRGAFYGYDWLTEITLPESVKKIGDYTFYRCKNLDKIEWPTGLTEIGSYAFGDTAFEEFEIPETVSKIGNNAFTEMKIKEIVIPENVTQIPSGAFAMCRQLENVVFTGEVSEIGSRAFTMCDKLKTIKLPDTITVIGLDMFWGCYSLESVIIPKGVTEIGRGAFGICPKLKELFIPKTVTIIGDAIVEESERVYIYGEEGSYAEKYASDNGIAFVPTDYYNSVQ